jgi:hypothetical protein
VAAVPIASKSRIKTKQTPRIRLGDADYKWGSETQNAMGIFL